MFFLHSKFLLKFEKALSAILIYLFLILDSFLTIKETSSIVTIIIMLIIRALHFIFILFNPQQQPRPIIVAYTVYKKGIK